MEIDLTRASEFYHPCVMSLPLDRRVSPGWQIAPPPYILIPLMVLLGYEDMLRV